MVNTSQISVIIPLFNKEATIERAVRSVLDQTFTRFEVIIVDDGSTDRSLELAKSFQDPRVKTVSQTNAGPGAARNKGASLATGTLLAFLDADDEWRPEYLQRAAEALGVNPRCKAFVCGYDSGDFRAQRPNKVLILSKPRGPALPPFAAPGDVLKTHVDAMHSSCVVVRKSAFMRAGGFFIRDGCRYGEDSWLWSRVLFGGELFWEPDELVRFHIEDSALGFAVQKRSSARPISIYARQLTDGFDRSAREALRRLSQFYANMDYAILTSSGAWQAARGLRQQHGIGGRLGGVREAAHRLKRSIGRVAAECADRIISARTRAPQLWRRVPAAQG